MEQEKFSHEQKAIIKKVRNLPFGYKLISNAIDDDLENVQIQVDKKNQKVFVLITKPFLSDTTYENDVILEIFNQVNNIIEISFVFFNTLIESNLAETLPAPTSRDDVFTFGPGTENIPFVTMEITDPIKVDALIKYADIQVKINDDIDLT